MIVALLEGRLDMVVGTRVHEQDAAYRRGHVTGNKVLTGFLAMVFGRAFTDILSGFRIFSRRYVKSFPVLSGGFEIETELTVHALNLDLPVAEIETPYFARPPGSVSKLSTWRDGVRILANIVRRFGGAESFQFATFIVLLGMAGLVVLLFSDRLQQRIHTFVGLHFKRAQHDSVRIWAEFSRRLANVKDQAGLCTVSARLISETFEVLSVSVWLLDEQKEQFIAGASTAPQPGEATSGNPPAATSGAVVSGLRARPSPFDLEGMDEPWAEELRQLNPTMFPTGGHRWCVPLRAGEQSLGAVVLADRVNGAVYTVEQLQLLECIADQVTSVLLNLRLANEVTRSRELEAFRTMSAFFVHDLKNAAASLNLMLKNLPVHFDDPAFREDALRGIGNTARRIDEMIGRLSALRQRPDVKPVEADLNQLVSEVLEGLNGMAHVELTKELQPLPRILADREQIQSAVTNLVLNARDALGPEGRISIRTEHIGSSAVLSVTDNGCGMSAAFLKDSLFRPFQSTKKKGLGIGMFQSRMIVEAHGGTIRVESEAGKGSTFRVSLPAKRGVTS